MVHIFTETRREGEAAKIAGGQKDHVWKSSPELRHELDTYFWWSVAWPPKVLLYEDPGVQHSRVTGEKNGARRVLITGHRRNKQVGVQAT